jgi:hypothetical protein
MGTGDGRKIEGRATSGWLTAHRKKCSRARARGVYRTSLTTSCLLEGWRRTLGIQK